MYVYNIFEFYDSFGDGIIKSPNEDNTYDIFDGIGNKHYITVVFNINENETINPMIPLSQYKVLSAQIYSLETNELVGVYNE